MDWGLEGSTSNKGTSKWSVNMWKKCSTSLLNRVIQIENTTKCTHNHTGSLEKKKTSNEHSNQNSALVGVQTGTTALGNWKN